MSKCLDELLAEYGNHRVPGMSWTVRSRGNFSIGHTHYVGAQIEDLNTSGVEELLVLVPSYRDDKVTWDSAGPTPPAKPLDGWRNANLFDGHGSAWYPSGWSVKDNVLWLRPSYNPDKPARTLRGPTMRLRVTQQGTFTDRRGVEYVLAGSETPSHFVDATTCGTCGRTWNDGVSTGVTPAPSGRCPFENDHR